MLSLVYISSSRGLFSESTLLALLEKAREKNSRLDITGMLLYKDGNIMQVLEGPDAAVRELFKTIEMDDRHRGMIELLQRQIEEREFPDWKMAFRDLNDPALQEVVGYSEFLNESLDSEMFRKSPSQAYRLLEIFRGK